MQKHLTQKSTDVSWNKTGKNEGRTREDLLLSSLLIPERKRARNIGSKSKRLHIDSQDALELKLTWEEAQDLLRPPPAVKPSILMIEDHEFEEYEVSTLLVVSIELHSFNQQPKKKTLYLSYNLSFCYFKVFIIILQFHRWIQTQFCIPI